MVKHIFLFLSLIPYDVFSSRVPGETALWEFDREDCYSGIFPNNATTGRFGSLKRNETSYSSCLDGRGIKASSGLPSETGIIVESYLDIHEMMEVSPEGLTIEIWGDFDSNTIVDGVNMPIFTVGQGNNSNAPYCDSDVEELSMNFQVGLLNQQLYVTFADVFGSTVISSGTYDDSDDLKCSKTQTLKSIENVSHILVTINQTNLIVYMDGLNVYQPDSFTQSELTLNELFEDSGGSGASAFSPNYKVQLFNDQDAGYGNIPYSGSIWYLALYEQYLTPDQVLENYNAKLPESEPSVYDMTVSVNEDGEAVAGAKYTTDPAYYQTECPIPDLGITALDAVDQDEDPYYPNYDAKNIRDFPLEVYISYISPGTVLYTYDGDEIIPCPNDEMLTNPNINCKVPRPSSEMDSNFTSPFYVRIRPPFNQFGSKMLNFSYWAIDGVTRKRSTKTAIALITVKSVNDPPIARSFTQTVIGDSIAIITLNATDIDGWKGPHAFAWGYILNKPSNGDIYRIYLNQTVLSNPINFTQEVSPYELNIKPHELTTNKLTSTQSVAYVFTGNQSKLADPVTGVIASDIVSFYVMDINGQISISANVSLSITKGIEAILPEDEDEKTVYEETWGDIHLYGDDQTLNPQNLSFRIVSLPNHGILRDKITKQLLSVGDVIEQQVIYPYTEAAIVEYLSDDDYFNSPSVMWNGSTILNYDEDGFDFHTFRTGEALFYSSDVYISIQVINVNDCPSLTVMSPDGSITGNEDDDSNNNNEEVEYVYKVKAIGVPSDAYKVWDEDDYNPKDLLNDFGVLLSDAADKDVDVIKVRISVKKGLVGFRVDNSYDDKADVPFFDELDFNSEDYCHLIADVTTVDDDLLGYSSRLRKLSEHHFQDHLHHHRNLLTTNEPTVSPAPTLLPSLLPILNPTILPSNLPTSEPSFDPTSPPSTLPTTSSPTVPPTSLPTKRPSLVPTSLPTVPPTSLPTKRPSLVPTSLPSLPPTPSPTKDPTFLPTSLPTSVPTPLPLYDVCIGDGSFDKEMVFLGQPSQVRRVLQLLTYMCTKPHVTDELTIEIWDGSTMGTGCLSENDFKTYSKRSECCTEKKMITIEVGDYAFKSSITDSTSIPAGFYAPFAFIPVFIYVCYFRRKMRLRRLKREKMDPGYAERMRLQREADKMSFCSIFICRSCDKNPALSHNDNDNGENELEMMPRTMRPSRDRSSLDVGEVEGKRLSTRNPLQSDEQDEQDALLGCDDYPCSTSNTFYDKMRKAPGYSMLVQQEDAVATSGAFDGLGSILTATESGEGDAMAWHVQYVSGKPLFTHIRTGFRTFDKPPALASEEGQRMLQASKPVSTLSALPVESDWFEHKVRGTDGMVYYRDKNSDRVTWEDPYKCTLAAAADMAGDDHIREETPTVLHDSWKKCKASGEDGAVYWANALTGETQWEEPGTGHIRRAIREAEKEAARNRQEVLEEIEAEEAAALLASSLNGGGGDNRGSLLRRATNFLAGGRGGDDEQHGSTNARSTLSNMRKSMFGGSSHPKPVLRKSNQPSKGAAELLESQAGFTAKHTAI